MSKLKSEVLYQCTTSFRAICIFYLIQYAIVLLIALIYGIGTGNYFESIGSNCLEMNSLIFVGIFGVLGFTEDFKMLIQNGFTRKYIYLSTVSLFTFMAGVMAFIDTVVGQTLHFAVNKYSAMFGSVYGYDNVFANWIALMVLYFLMLNLFYLVILVINKVGKRASVYLGVILSGIVLLTIALFRYVLSAEAVRNVVKFLTKAMGFMADGTINHLLPVLTLLSVAAILGGCSYAVIRHTELK